MIMRDDSVLALIEMMKRKAPEYLDLISSETEEEFNAAFDSLLDKAVCHLEINSKNFNKLDEEALTAVLAAALSMPGLSVTQEPNSNGHVDLAIVADHCTPTRKKLGEAKIYKGFDYHISGLKQLLGRYTTGTESRGLLIAYFKKRNIKGLSKKLRDRMDMDLPHNQQNKAIDHLRKWSFITTHEHSSGENLQVGHICCNLYFEE